MRIVLTTWLVAMMYNSRGYLLCGVASTGWVERRALSSTNAASTSSFHSNTSNFFISWYEGNAFSPILEMNRLNASRHLVSLWTSCTRTGLCIYTMAPIFSGLTSIPRSETRKSSNLPPGTPKVHLAGFILMSYFLRLAIIYARLVNRSEPLRDLTIISSMYASTFRLIWSSMHFWIIFMKVAPAFFKPKGMVI